MTRRSRPTARIGSLLIGGFLIAGVASACTSAATVTRPAPTTTVATTPSPSPLPSATVQATPGPQRRLRVALDREPTSLDPAEVREQAGLAVVDAVNDSLTRMSDNLAVAQPAAARNWEVSGDLRRWTFELRAGATWHDGTPVVAADFVRAFRHLSPGGAAPPFNAWLLAPIADDQGMISVEAPDDTTLVVALPAPMADLPVLLSHPALAPRPPAGLDVDQPVGNGPFQLAEPWAHNQFVRLAPTDDAQTALDEVLLPIYAQRGAEEVQYADFRAGALDVAEVPVDEVEQARTLFGRAEDGEGPGVLGDERTTLHYLGFHTDRAPWSDPDLRRAVSLLIDREVLVSQVGREARGGAEGLVAPGLPGAGVATCDHCDRDLVAALAVLAGVEAIPDGPVRLLTPDDVASHRVATVIANSVADGLDVDVVLDARPLAGYAAALVAGEFDLFLGAWTPGRPNMGGVLEPLVGSSSDSLDNPGRIDLDVVDRALGQASRSASPTQRLRAWQDAEQAALDATVVAPLYFPRTRLVVAEDVDGFRLRPDGLVDLTAVTVEPDD